MKSSRPLRWNQATPPAADSLHSNAGASQYRGMGFHLGKPILVMAILAVSTGAALVRHQPPPRKDLLVWVFAEEHFKAYQPLVGDFERETGLTVDLRLVQESALNR